MNPAVAFKTVADAAHAVVLTSGTLAPLEGFASEVSGGGACKRCCLPLLLLPPLLLLLLVLVFVALLLPLPLMPLLPARARAP